MLVECSDVATDTSTLRAPARRGPRASARAASPAPASERRLFLIDGPSLVYRAFFALPESIATSTGEPTNAIFGFASMLVKIVTDYGVRPTVVAWDAGMSGGREMYPEYKAQRRSRPDLLKQQWPAMEPLVEAFGYRNVRVEGYEADDVIASLAEHALHAEPPVPVTIVTGDRDVFQLIDERDLVRVMATARGITETKIYDRQAVIDRYGIPPGADPRLLRAEGRHLRQHPRHPGDRREDGQRADPELRLARGGARPRRGDQRRQAQTEPASSTPMTRACPSAWRRCSAMWMSTSTSPPRRCASPTARGCARCSAATSCATRCGAWRRRSATPSSRRRRPPRR